MSRTLLFAAALLLPSVSPSAQSLTFGDLSGTVTDAQRAPVADVEVSATDIASGATRRVTTGRDGRFRFGALAAGRYTLLAEALGFHPVVVTPVAIAAGHNAIVSVTLRAAVPPVTVIDTVRTTPAASTALSWLQERGYADLLGARRTLGDIALLSTTADEFGVEGLPWRLAGITVDGSRSTPFGAPSGDGAEAAGLAFPLRGLASAQAGGLGFDVEAGGSGVGLSAQSLRGGSAAELRGSVEGGTANVGGAVLASGPLQGDTAQAIIGADYQRSEVTRPALFGADPAAATAYAAAAAINGTDLSQYGAEASRLEERWSGFGRFDFQPGDRVAVTMRASGSRLASSGLAEPFGAAARLGTDQVSLMGQASINVFARLSSRFTQEFRISADVADAQGDGTAAISLPQTTLAGAGLSVGRASYEPFDESRTTPRAAAILHARLGSHQLKAGLAAAVHRVNSRSFADAAGEFSFGDPADLAAGVGAWRRVEGSLPAGEFSMTERAFFVQDAWSPAAGLSLTLGARWDASRLPGGEIEQNAEWLALSGIDNRDLESRHSTFSPRLGLRWELGSRREWVIEGGAGIFQELPDSRDLAEALGRDRSAVVRYGTGALGAWPSDPSTSAAAPVGSTISLLGPEFEGPRTRRLSLALSNQRGAWNLFASGVYRHTDFLSRRRDINLPAGATGTDQNGRPLFGTLEQHGSILAVAPQSNRRFPQFDAVHVLESSGYSDFWAVTTGLERVREAGFSLGLSYTFSRTTDNISGFGTALTPSPFPTLLGGLDWTDGKSDRDIPHRLLAAAEWTTGPTAPLRLGLVYRLQSGAPFTPGVRDGVDANGDGSWVNDPAFVDAALPGMDALLAANSCLEESIGGFVARNSCRADLQHRLDLRAAIRIMNLSAGRLELVLDALDVIAQAAGRVDHALLLVDRAGALTFDPGTGVTQVPYVVNPNFGQILADRSPGVLWRVGLRIVP